MKRPNITTDILEWIEKLDLAHPSPIERQELRDFLIQVRRELIDALADNEPPTEQEKQVKNEAKKVAAKIVKK